MKKLYWAYGSNLNERAMARRCPGAVKVRALIVRDAALVFRSVADVVHRPGATTHGGLWRITPRDEEALDRYEGVASGLYLKKHLLLKIKGRNERCLFYQMSESRGVMPPNEAYLNTIAEGYGDFGLPLEALDAALREAWDNKKLTERVVRRHVRRGGVLAWIEAE